MKQTIFSEAAYSPNKTEKPIKYNNCIPRREAGDFSMFVQPQRFFRLRADRTDYGALKHILLTTRVGLQTNHASQYDRDSSKKFPEKQKTGSGRTVSVVRSVKVHPFVTSRNCVTQLH